MHLIVFMRQYRACPCRSGVSGSTAFSSLCRLIAMPFLPLRPKPLAELKRDLSAPSQQPQQPDVPLQGNQSASFVSEIRQLLGTLGPPADTNASADTAI